MKPLNETSAFTSITDSIYIFKKRTTVEEQVPSSSSSSLSVDFEEYIQATNKKPDNVSIVSLDRISQVPSLRRHRAIQDWKQTHNMGFINDYDRLKQLYLINNENGSGNAVLPRALSVHTDKLLNTKDNKAILDLGFRKSRADVLKKLNILKLIFQCDYDEGRLQNIIPYLPFGWTKSAFLLRYTLPNNFWIDTLRREYSPICLQSIKLKCEIDIIINILEKIYQMLLGDSQKKEIKEFLDDCAGRETIGFKIRKEYETNRSNFDADIKTKFAINLKRRSSAQQSKTLEEAANSADVFDPIVSRYRVNWYRSRVEQTDMKIGNVINNFQEGITDYKEEIEMENFVSSCILNTYYAEIERLRSKVVEFQILYDQRIEEWDTKITNKKHGIKKLLDKQKFYESEIERFHREIEERLAWEEAQELKKQQKEEERLAALAAAQAKKKKRKPKKK